MFSNYSCLMIAEYMRGSRSRDHMVVGYLQLSAESSGSKNWWNLVKRLLGSSKNRSIPPLQTDDDLICDNFAKCELINDFFQ